MASLYLFLILSISFANSQNPQISNQNLKSVTLEENVLDDRITEIFNICKCVIFYQCDEENFIIPKDQIIHTTNITSNKSLRNVRRIRCSNEFYYCCKSRNETQTPIQCSTPPPPPPLSTTTLPPTTPPTSLSNSNCGRAGLAASSKIIEKFPWIVAIYQKRKPGIYRFVCGGSLIHPRVVMTERKCVHSYLADDFRVVAGRENLGENVTHLAVREIIKHGASNREGIGLLVLQSPLTNTRNVCLPNLGQNFSGRWCTAVGWSGATQSGSRKLRKVNLSITDFESCGNLLNFSISDNRASYICALGEDGENTCKNEGGTPLMCEENGRYVQMGVMPWGLTCGQKDVPILYTNIANLVTWIREKLRNF